MKTSYLLLAVIVLSVFSIDIDTATSSSVQKENSDKAQGQNCITINELPGYIHMPTPLILSVPEEYVIKCITVSGPAISVYYVPNSTQATPYMQPANESSITPAPLTITSLNGSKLETAINAGSLADLPIKLGLSQGYKVFSASLLVANMPPKIHAEIYPDLESAAGTLNSRQWANGTMHVYIDSDARPGKYVIRLVAVGAFKDPSGKIIDLHRDTVGLLDLTVTKSNDAIWMDVGLPDVHQKLFCFPGQCTSMPPDEEFPVTVYSKERTAIKLEPLGFANGTYVKILPDYIVADPQGSSARMIMVGSVTSNVGWYGLSHMVAEITAVSAEDGNNSATDYVPVEKENNIQTIHFPQKITLEPVPFTHVSVLAPDSSFWMLEKIYDPQESTAEKTLSVNLSVLGLANGTGVVPLPSWFSVGIPVSSFTLDAARPYYFIIKYAVASSAPLGNYTVIVGEHVGGLDFTENIPVTIENLVTRGNGTNYIVTHQSPLGQIEQGIPARDVKCEQGLQLVIKTEDGSPACVKPKTASILIGRGWAANMANHGPPMKPFGRRIQINGNVTNGITQPLIPPSSIPRALPTSHHFNYTAGLYTKVPNWNQKFVCYKYAGYAIQMTAEISSALKFSSMVTDPNGMTHNVTSVALNSTLMQIQFTASSSDPDGSYSIVFNVVNRSNTSNVNFYCAGAEMVEPRIPPALHPQPP